MYDYKLVVPLSVSEPPYCLRTTIPLLVNYMLTLCEEIVEFQCIRLEMNRLFFGSNIHQLILPTTLTWHNHPPHLNTSQAHELAQEFENMSEELDYITEKTPLTKDFGDNVIMACHC